MTDLPDEAVTAAAEALRQHQAVSLNRSHVDCSCGWSVEPTPKPGERALLIELDDHLATAAMSAALPILREHIAEKIEARAAEVWGSMGGSGYHTYLDAARIVREGRP